MFLIPEEEVSTVWEGLLASSGEILVVNKRKVLLDRKHFGFLLQVIDRGHPKTADGYAEGRVLDN